MESFGIRSFPFVRGGLKRLAEQIDSRFDVQRELV